MNTPEFNKDMNDRAPAILEAHNLSTLFSYRYACAWGIRDGELKLLAELRGIHELYDWSEKGLKHTKISLGNLVDFYEKKLIGGD